MSKPTDKINRWLKEHHKCKNYIELYSITHQEFGEVSVITSVEYRCGMCGRRVDPSFYL